MMKVMGLCPPTSQSVTTGERAQALRLVPKINENERKMLAFFADNYAEYYFCFATISADTGLDRKQVRKACRSLKRKGLAKFCSGLWTEDGAVAGSGYSATDAGHAVFESLTNDDHSESKRPPSVA